MWAKIGVKTKLVAEPMAHLHAVKVQNFDASAYLLGWGVATYDAQYMLQSLVRTKTPPAPTATSTSTRSAMRASTSSRTR
jgi:peptide/nickel transport system substrate-binding protein